MLMTMLDYVEIAVEMGPPENAAQLFEEGLSEAENE